MQHQRIQLTIKQSTMALTRGLKVKTQTPPSEKCLFLTLPPELRVRIYHLLIQTDSKRPILIRGPSVSKIGRLAISRRNIPTLFIFTCRQIKNEIVALYCQLNIFKFVTRPRDYAWSEEAFESKPVCPWWLADHIPAMRNFHVTVDHNHYLHIALSNGLENATVHLFGYDRLGRSQGSELESTRGFEAAIHRLIAAAADEAEEKGADLILNEETLARLLLLTDERRMPFYRAMFLEELDSARANS